jgi:hypothetical protein
MTEKTKAAPTGPCEMDEAVDATRRWLFTAGAAAVTGVGVVLACQDQAKAQIFGGDGGIDLGPFEDFFALFEQVVQVVEFPTAGRVRALIDDILGLLEGTDGSFIGTTDPAGPMEESFPTEGVLTPDDQAAMTMNRANLIRGRVDQAVRINGTAVQAQGEIALEEEAIVAAATAGQDFALTSLLQGILLMQQQTNLRLGQNSFQMAALSQQLADQMLLQSNPFEQSQMAAVNFLGGAADAIAAPVDRPAQ